MKKSAGLPAVVMTAALLMAACSAETGSGSDGGDSSFPERDLTLIAASDPGGGLDLASRAVEEALTTKELIEVGLQVEGIGGGGGNPARAALLERPADGYTVVAESNRAFLNPLTGTTDIEHTEFVPVAKLMTEYLVWVVKADSPYESAQDVLDALADDPASVRFGIATAPSDDQFNILRPLQEAGIDPAQVNITTFSGGGDLLTNLLGGRADVVSTGIGELAGLQGSDVRVLVSSAPEAQGGDLEGVPTWHDAGIDFELDHWRGIFGPADMPDDAVQWWSDTLAEMAETPTWSERLAQNGWTPDFQDSETFAETVQTQYDLASQIVEELGLGG